MKDFLGNEVVVGDQVATMAKNYRQLVKAKIVSITPKTVVVEYLNNWNYGTPGRPETYRVDSNMFIKVGD